MTTRDPGVRALRGTWRRRGAAGVTSPGQADVGASPSGFGDPAAEYQAATSGCGFLYRSDRRLLRVYGRAPREMLNGILTNRIPDPPAGSDLLAGEAVYGAMLTAKGRMVTDVRTYWLGAGGEAGLGLDVAAAGYAGTLGHFTRFLPPRLARAEPLAEGAGLLTVAGPGARETVAAVFGVAPEGGYALQGGGPLAGGALVSAAVEQIPSWNVWLGPGGLPAAWRRMEAAGAEAVGSDVWDTLRTESGFPAYGADMDERTIPIEAGLGERAFDHAKGCYTGQEVIVRIRHRGRVNWHLRALRFGNADAQAGQRLFAPGDKKPRGRVTSAVRSPRFGQMIGLGYVWREVEPPATLCLESESGPTVKIEKLDV